MTTIIIDRRGLAAVMLFAAKRDIRYYLNGVKVEATNAATRLIGCNGHTLGVHHTVQSNTVENPTELIVPDSVLRHVAKASKRTRGLPIELHSTDDPVEWILHDYAQGARFLFKAIEGNYPDYMKVVPKEASGEPAAYNPEYLMAVKKAGEALGLRQSMLVAQNGNQGGIASSTMYPEFVAVVMPLRDDAPRKRPRWLDTSLMTPAVKQADAVPA